MAAEIALVEPPAQLRQLQLHGGHGRAQLVCRCRDELVAQVELPLQLVAGSRRVSERQSQALDQAHVLQRDRCAVGKRFEQLDLVGAGTVMRRPVVADRAERLLSALGLGHRLTHRPSQLSGGEQQRVAVARALANRPALVLADEPTGNLDEATADVVLAEFLRLVRGEGSAALVATHNERLAARMDRVVRLHEGVLE